MSVMQAFQPARTFLCFVSKASEAGWKACITLGVTYD